MKYEELRNFILEDMKPDTSSGEPKNYQPVMILVLNQNHGKATKKEITNALEKANSNRTLPDGSFATVCKTLQSHKIVERKGDEYFLLDYDTIDKFFGRKAEITKCCYEKIQDLSLAGSTLESTPTDGKTFDDRFEEGEKLVKEFLEKEYNEPFINFEHIALVEEREYKLKIYQSARKELNLSKWNEWIKTPGKIIDAVKKATEVDPKNNNLLDITGKRGPENNSNACLYQIVGVKEFEKVLYDFFLGGPSNSKSLGPRFNSLSEFISKNKAKSDWRFLSYLLFLFNSDLFFPIGPQKFDKALNFYGIFQKLSYEKKTWEKYTLLIDLVNKLGSKLSEKYGPVSNLQVQSYLWELVRAIEKSSVRKKALYVTNNFPLMLEEFQKIVATKGRAFYAIGNWNPASLSTSDYPLHMYLQSKGNIVAVFTINSILNSKEFDKIENKMSYRVTQKPGDIDSPTSAFLELIETNILSEPVPIGVLNQYGNHKIVDYFPQRMGYVVDIGIPTNNDSNHWIWSVTPENWEIVKAKKIWASRIGQNIRDRVRPGDKVIFYVQGTNEFQGIFEFIGEWYDAPSPVWSDEIDSVIYQSQIKLKTVALGFVRVYDVAHELKMFANPDDKRLINLILKGGGGYPSNNTKPILYQDYERLLELFNAITTNTNYFLLRHKIGSSNQWRDDIGKQYHFGKIPNYKKLIPGTKTIWYDREDGDFYFWGYGEISRIEKESDEHFHAHYDNFIFFNEPEKANPRSENVILKKGSNSIKEKILNLPTWNHQISMPRITKEIYDEIVNGRIMSSITISKPVNDHLTIPSEKDIEQGIKEIKKVLLIDDEVIKEIVVHLAGGRHVLLSGPVGTGKTKLAQMIPGVFWKENHGYFADVHTATADWSTYDVIGGLSPKMNSDAKDGISYEIEKGCVTKTIFDNFNKEKFDSNQFVRSTSTHTIKNQLKEFHGTWLVIDEFNRADIDKAFGQLFTALEYKKLQIPSEISKESFRTIPIPNDYRIIGTLNTADKHYLFNLSDALKRRFAYVEIPIPKISAKNKQREIFLSIKYGLKDIDDDFTSLIQVDEKELNYKIPTIESQFNKAFEILSFIRQFKPLGTAILKSIYQTMLVSIKIGDKNSLDRAINANIIPQLENLPKSTLEIIYNFLFGDVGDFLLKSDQKERYLKDMHSLFEFVKFDEEKEIESAIKQYASEDGKNIMTKLGTKVRDALNLMWLEDIPAKDMRKNMPIFSNSLLELIKQTELF